jgi:DnaJ-class molecular chaperone
MSNGERDLYEILGIDKKADNNAINKAYKRLVIQWHPDKHQGASKEKLEEITNIFKDIQYAKEVLSDEHKRKVYDQYGFEGLNNNINTHNQQPNFNNMNDFFNNIFGNGFGNINLKFNFNTQNKNQNDIHFRHAFSLEDLYKGININIKFERFSKCKTCNGMGSRDGKEHTCNICQGRGVKLQMIGPNMLSQSLCNNCNGSGKADNYARCNTCNGEHVVLEEYLHEIHIPKGTKDQQNIHYHNIGHEIIEENRRSNVILVVSVLPNKLYEYHSKGREEDIIMTDFSISLAESLCGFTKEIKGLGGEMISVSYDKPIRHGYYLILENHGMPYFGQENKYGNLHLKVNVILPEDITENFLVKNRIWQILTNTPFKEKYEGKMLKKQ